MYTPAAYAQPEVTVLHECIRMHPLGALVTMTADGLDANHIPFLVTPEPAPYGTLRAHVARANPVWQHLEAARCLVIFQGPNSYVSPSWYPSKATAGKVVPTWNYAVVHAHGAAKVMDDAGWVAAHLAALTDAHEAARLSRWQITDAPADYVSNLTRAVVGIEIHVEQLLGKWKLSQNRSEADRAGVIEGLSREATASGDAMAALMRRVHRPSTAGTE